VGYEVSVALNIQDEVFRMVTLCSNVVGYQRFGGPCCLHLQGEVKIETVRYSKTLLSYHIITWHLSSSRNVPDRHSASKVITRFFMKTEGSLPCSQEPPATGPYSELDASSPQFPPCFHRFNLILSSHLHLGLPSGLFPSDFPTKILHRYMVSHFTGPQLGLIFCTKALLISCLQIFMRLV
jgi:hypothetical protein